MTDLKILNLVKKDIRNIHFLFEWIITNTHFLIKNKEIADRLIDLYIFREYKDMLKNDIKSLTDKDIKESAKFINYQEKRKEQLASNNTNFKTINEYIDTVITQYRNYTNDNILVSDLEHKISKSKDKNYTVFKYDSNSYYWIDNSYLELLWKYTNKKVTLYSKPYQSDNFKVSPFCWFSEEWTFEILIMPLNLDINDYDYNHI